MTIPYPSRCPECGTMHNNAVIFYRKNQPNNFKNNLVCKECKKKGKNITGYNNEINSSGDLIFIKISCSGIENSFNQSNLRCPICNLFQHKATKGVQMHNVSCKNPECKAIGYDYFENDTSFVTVASGIIHEVADFCNIKYNKSRLGKNKLVGRSYLSSRVTAH